MSSLYGLTPLHKAVINDDLMGVKSLLGKYEECCDDLGFTPLELAQLLNRAQCEEILSPQIPMNFLVELKGSSGLIQMKMSEFEDQFKLEYTRHLVFQSYEHLCEVVRQCPYLLRSPRIAEDNHAYTRQFRNEMDSGLVADVSVRWIDEEFGYGLFAERDLDQGEFIGEYTGEVRQLSWRGQDQNGYCLHYHTKWWSIKYYAIDALLLGNLMRFINHSDEPNVQPLCAVDRGLLHYIFVARNSIKKGDQLFLNYGVDYWTKRRKM